MGRGGVVQGWWRGRKEWYIPLSNYLHQARGQMLPLPQRHYYYLYLYILDSELEKKKCCHRCSSVNICNHAVCEHYWMITEYLSDRVEEVTAWWLNGSAGQDWKGRTRSHVSMWCHQSTSSVVVSWKDPDRAKQPRDKTSMFSSAVVSSLTLNYAYRQSSHSSLQTAPFLAPPQPPTPHLLFLLNTFILAPTILGSCLLFIAIDSTAAFFCNELCKADKVRWHRHMGKYFIFLCACCVCLHVLISASLAVCVCECWSTLSCHQDLHRQTSSRSHTFFCVSLNTPRLQLPVSVEIINILSFLSYICSMVSMDLFSMCPCEDRQWSSNSRHCPSCQTLQK